MGTVDNNEKKKRLLPPPPPPPWQSKMSPSKSDNNKKHLLPPPPPPQWKMPPTKSDNNNNNKTLLPPPPQLKEAPIRRNRVVYNTTKSYHCDPMCSSLSSHHRRHMHNDIV
ncbi:hypothetical protein LINGRAHAP2_LOCUS25376 [Linum grandiflorum]